MSEGLLEQLRRHEGLRLKPYKDTVGKWTIGIGRNLDDVGITEAEALHLLANDVKRVKKELDYRIPWWSELPPKAKQVLQNMCFNLGWPRLAGFRKFLDALERRQYSIAADEMLDSRWAQQVGYRARELSDMVRSIKT